MKRFSLLLFTVLASTLAARAESSVWKVTRDGRALYLGGTCHLLRDTDLPIPAEFDAAFAAADSVCFETDIERLRSLEAQQMLLARAAYTDGGTLDAALSPEARDAVRAYCAKSGLPAAALQTFKPWMVTLTILTVEAQRLGFTSEGVDVRLSNKAREAGKALEQLETLEQQVEFLSNMGAGQESEMVLATLKDLARMPELLDDIIAAWRAGDLDRIDVLMSADMRRDFPKVFEELLVKRNQTWMPKIEAMLKTAPVEFVLVGAGHLAGDDGILRALEKSGCTIEQMRARN